jgi:hypothetical protein
MPDGAPLSGWKLGLLRVLLGAFVMAAGMACVGLVAGWFNGY